MSEWREVRLGDLAQRITSGGTPLTKHFEYYGGDIPWLNTKEIKNCRVFETKKYITELGLNNSSAKFIDSNSVIVAMYGMTAGKVAINKIPLTTNQACCNITLDKKKADYSFIYYLLLSSFKRLDSLTSGAAQQNLNIGLIANLEILLPPLKEQKAIAEVLSSLDDKIDLLHQQNKTLENLAQTLFRQWFVEEVKDDWETGILNDILTVKGGTTPSTKNDEYWNGNICWSTPKDLSLNSDMYLSDTTRKITESGLAKIGSGLLPKGTILLSSRAPVGYLAIAKVPLAINQGYMAILDNKGFSKYFIFLWIKLNMEYIISNANGSTFLEISKAVFKSLKIIKPPTELRKKFDEIVIENFEKIKVNCNQIKTLENTRDTLLPKLMSGEVGVDI